MMFFKELDRAYYLLWMAGELTQERLEGLAPLNLEFQPKYLSQEEFDSRKALKNSTHIFGMNISYYGVYVKVTYNGYYLVGDVSHPERPRVTVAPKTFRSRAIRTAIQSLGGAIIMDKVGIPPEQGTARPDGDWNTIIQCLLAVYVNFNLAELKGSKRHLRIANEMIKRYYDGSALFRESEKAPSTYTECTF